MGHASRNEQKIHKNNKTCVLFSHYVKTLLLRIGKIQAIVDAELMKQNPRHWKKNVFSFSRWQCLIVLRMFCE